MNILVTGATGYIGGRLAPRLMADGHHVRCMTRDAARLDSIPWARDGEIVEADAGDATSLKRALDGIDVAYYLIHSIDTGSDFGATDRAAAETFGRAAKDAGVRRIVYLGGMVPPEADVSDHLASRREVGDVLLASGVPTTVLQAAVVIGSGSASFEMLRYLTERLPFMITPRWVGTRTQPIAVRDVLRYLTESASMPPDVSRRFDIAGPDVLTYGDMMRRYASVGGLRRRVIVPVPVLSPKLSAHWVNVVTPVPARIAKPLVASLANEVVAQEHDIARWVPDPPAGLIGFEESVRLALLRTNDGEVETRWSAAAWPGAPSDPLPTDPAWAGGSLYVDERSTPVDAPAAALWDVIQGIGGDNGWYSWPLAWAVRGWMDRLSGGVGLRRGRRDPRHVYVGEALDWWRVEAIEPGSVLRLRAEMKVPGEAWLELRVEHTGDGVTYHQRALFRPRGLAGHAYWRAISPFHGVVFGGMMHNIARAAERTSRSGARTGR